MTKKIDNDSGKSKDNNPDDSKINDIDVTEQVKINLDKLMRLYKINGKQLAEITHTPPSTISEYKTGKKTISLEFLLQLKLIFKISIDDFLTKDLTPADSETPASSNDLEQEERNSYSQYEGTFYLYYFDTSVYKGDDKKTPAESLRYGVMHIYSTPSEVDQLSHSAACIMGIDDFQDAMEIHNQIEVISHEEQNNDVVNYINTNHSKHAYYGNFEMNRNHAFISLKHSNKDQALIILHRISSEQEAYNSGIGTVNSVSKGRDHMPAVQFIGLSRYKTNLSIDEIHRMLLLGYISISDSSDTDELLSAIKRIYDVSESAKSDFQRDVTVKGELSRYIRTVVERNLFRVAKVSSRDDDTWYHDLKDKFIIDTPKE